MKRYTGLAIIFTAVIGCSYVGPSQAKDYVYDASTTCTEVWGLSGIESQTSYQIGKQKFPEITANMKRALVEACESAKEYGENGGSVETVMGLIARNPDRLPAEGVKNQAFMMISGWKIGSLSQK